MKSMIRFPKAKHSRLLYFFSLFISYHSEAQIPTETWRTHANYTATQGVEIVQNKVYAFSNDGFFFYDKSTNQATTLSKIDGLNGTSITKIRYNKASQQLLVAYQDGDMDLLTMTSTGLIDKIQNINFIQNTTAIQGSKRINQIAFQGNYAYLATDFGLVELDITKPEVKETYQNIGKNGISLAVKDVLFSKDSIFVNTNQGILEASFSSAVNLQYYGSWTTLTNTKIFQTPNYPQDPLIVAPQEMATDADGKLWIADSTNGLLSNFSGKFASYTPNGIFDKALHLYYSNNLIYVQGASQWSVFEDNTWKPSANMSISNDIIDENGFRWHIIGNGILISDSKTNRSIVFSNGLPSTTVNTLAEDQDSQIWIGTSNGVAVVSSSANIFNGTLVAYTPIYQQRRLLIQENVSKIVVDGGNRKWMGTSHGIFLFDAAAEQLIQNFTTSNSPLPSNTILDIALNNQSGEVFIATDAGLVSYQGDATTAATNFAQVKIFPNPVRPEFQGVLTISGLMENSFVKITDEAGRLIYATTANGGTATWNLLDRQGNHVPTGVYLVFAVATDGSENFVGKFALIR